MTRQSLYRRFRPQRFSDVRGQDDLAGALRRAVAEDRVGQAYLFSGPRGTGKTTTARILAKALNCTDLHDGEPCGVCESCVAIAEGSSFDVFELDAASHNGVDAMRDLIERASQGTPGRRKVYILDEAHMLSKGAANALLKTLEEPPDHVVFVLATTDPQKLLPTVVSRTQHFEVHLLDTPELTALVDEVAEAAGLDVTDEARQWAVRTGAGSARDTLSALERAAAMGGIPDAVTEIDPLVDALAGGDTAAALQIVDRAVRAGRSPQDIGNEIVERLRHIFLTTMGVAPGDLPDGTAATVGAQAQALGPRGATHALEVLGEALVGISAAPDPRVPLELSIVRITQPEHDSSPSALLGRIERLERAFASGATTVPQAPDLPPVTPDLGVTPLQTPAPTADDDAATTAAVASGPDGAAAAARQALASHRRPAGQTTRRPPPVAATDVAPPPVATAVSPRDEPTPQPSPSPASGGRGPDTASTTAAASAGTPAGISAGDTTGDPTGDPTGDVVPAGSAITTAGASDAWERHVVQSPDQKVRARFGTGRLTGATDRTVIVALPNDRVLQRCKPLVPELQKLLAADLGGPVTIDLRVDAAGAAQPEPSRSAGHTPVAPATGDSPTDDSGAAEELDDIGNIDELEDAGDQGTDVVARLTEAFPGSELIEPDQETTP